MGNTTAKYRWFALVYLFGMFLVFPGFIFLLSLAGPIVIYVVFVPIAALLLLITMVNLLQRKNPKLLPAKLQNWEFLPEPVRSLEPVDRLVVSCLTRWIFSSIRYFLISLNIMFSKEIYFVWPRWRKHKQGDIENDRWGGSGSGGGISSGSGVAKTNNAFEADLTPV